MTVPVQFPVSTQIATGSSPDFTYDFLVLQKSDMTVTANGVPVQQSDFSITGLGEDNGGIVSILTGNPAAGVVMRMARQVPLSRDTDYQQSGDFRAKTVNDDFDRIWQALQDTNRDSIGSLKYPYFENIDGTLPERGSRLGMLLGFDPVNGKHIMVPPPASIGAGDMRVDAFVAGIDFTPGVTTQLALSRPPGTAANAEVFFDSNFQGPDQWSVAGSVLTFTGPIPVGVSKVFVRLGTTLSTMIPPDGSVTDATVAQGTKLYNRITDIVDIKDPGFGARGDGASDDRAAFAAAEAAGKAYTVPAGTYRIGSAITLSRGITLAPGAVLKPDNGVLVTIAGPVNAGLYQIFDRSAGGCIQFQTNALCRVFAEWWGAKADGVKTDNNVAIQQACDALQCVYANGGPFTPALNGDNNGGRVLLGFGGTYLVSGKIQSTNRVTLVGTGTGCEIKANAATWTGSMMFQFQNGTTPIFFSRLENLFINANDVAAITRVIYAPAWQESCGMRDVVIINHKFVGLYLDQGYGGSVGISLRDVQMFASANAVDPYGVYADFSTYSTGWYNLVMQNCSIFCGAPAGAIGRCVSIKGRVRLDVTALHVGEAKHGVYLETGAVLCGTTLAADSGTVTLITYDVNWIGFIDLSAPKKGFATALLRRSDSNWTLFRDFEPIFGRLRYPHPPGEIVALAAVNNGGTSPTLGTATRGFSAVTRLSAGLYRLTFDPANFSALQGSSYLAKPRPESVNAAFVYTSAQVATSVTVQFRDQAGTVADCTDFFVEICGNPGA